MAHGIVKGVDRSERLDEPELDHLMSRIRELAAHIHAAEARLATDLGALVVDGGWNASGDWRSLAHWMELNCGYARAEGRAVQRVAEAVAAGTMPLVMERARAGAMSVAVAAMAARIATPANDEKLANIAAAATPSQAARVFGAFRRALPVQQAAEASEFGAAEPDAPADQAEDGSDDGDLVEAFWSTWFDDHGAWCVRGRAPAEVGALLDEAYAAAHKAADRSASDADDPDGPSAMRPHPGVADALRELADMVLDNAHEHGVRKEGGDHFNVTVLIDLDTLVSGVIGADSICRLQSGPHVSPGLVRRLAEQGTLQLLWHQAGIPLKPGKEVRWASRHQRRALRFRDGGCIVPGCGQQRRLHAHHVEYYPDGPTDIENLVLLCSFHHRLVHNGGWKILTRGDQRFEIRDGRGEVVGNRLARDGRPPPGPLAEVPEHQTIRITSSTARPSGGYAPLTHYALDVWVAGLLSVEPEYATAS